MIDINWEDLKTLLDSRSVEHRHIELSNKYIITAFDHNLTLTCVLYKNSSDATEYEATHKALGEKKVVSSSDNPFTSKVLSDGKKIYSRVTGKKYALSAGSNTVEYAVTHSQIKFNELEIIGGEIGDTVNLKILDTAAGSYSTIPNYQLNQFGFDVNVSKEYFNRASSYDADLYIGMRVVIEYTSETAKEIGVNFIIHELKD